VTTEAAPARTGDGRQAARYRGVRDDLVRVELTPVTLRAAAEGDGTTMFGHFAVFNRWTEIDSFWEGRFMESFAPRSFKKTMRENRAGMRVLTEHGRDPQVGNRALGPIDVLNEDDEGAYYEVPLIDAQDVRELVLPRLQANLYGASFRFQVVREDVNNEPGTSAYNPEGIPERVVREARVYEFGPVTFPAYADASASVRCRSMTDEVVPAARAFVERRAMLRGILSDPALRARVQARAVEAGVQERVDAEDMGTLAQMIALGSEYIDEQDESDEQANTSRMEGVLAELAALMAVEAVEDEPDEPEDDRSGDPEPDPDPEPEPPRRGRLAPLAPRRKDDKGPFVPLPPR
jgi:HK97 family phage prohead protease